MSRTLVIEPLYCSQGGIPYNKAHLDAKDAEIERLRQLYAERGEMLRRANGQVLRLELEIERLRAEIKRLQEALKAKQPCQHRSLVGRGGDTNWHWYCPDCGEQGEGSCARD